MKIKRFPVFLLLFLLCNCTNNKNKPEESLAKQPPGEDASSLEAQPAPNQQWKDFVNTNADSIKSIYIPDAIRINEKGEVLEGRDAIQDFYQSKKWEIKQIESIEEVLANQEKGYTYEIGSFINGDGQSYRHLLIWKKEGAKLKRELEFIALARPLATDIEDEIEARRKEWMQFCNAHQAEKLANEVYSPEALYYNHKPLIRGRAALSKEYAYMNNPDYQLSLSPLHLETVSPDLALEMGQCAGSYGGKYILVWQKDEAGKWYVSFDSNI